MIEPVQIQQGVPFSALVYLTDDSVDPTIPLVITGKTVFISVKEKNDYSLDDSSAVITTKITVHVDSANGVTLWEQTAVETLVATKKYKADIRVYTDPTDFINTQTIDVDVVPVVTRRIL